MQYPPRKSWRRDLLLGAILLLALAAKLYYSGPRQVPIAARMSLGDAALNIVADPELIESYRIRPALQTRGATQPAKFFGRYPAIEKGRQFPDSTTREVVQALLQTTKASARQTHTGFKPNFGLRLWKNGKSVDVAVCFACGNLSFEYYENGEDGQPDRTLLKAFDGQKEVLLKAARQAFPGENFTG